MGSLLSKAQQQEENKLDGAWSTRNTLNAEDWDNDDRSEVSDDSSRRWLYASQGINASYAGIHYTNPAGPFTASEVELNRERIVYCSGPHRDADSPKAYTKDSHKTAKSTSQINIRIHYFEDGNHHVFKETKIKRWTGYKFDKRRRYAIGSKDIDVITLVDAKKAKNYMDIAWSEFTSNFTPFSEEESRPSSRGSHFDTSSWTVENANQKPKNVEKDVQQVYYYGDDRRGHHTHRHK